MVTEHCLSSSRCRSGLWSRRGRLTIKSVGAAGLHGEAALAEMDAHSVNESTWNTPSPLVKPILIKLPSYISSMVHVVTCMFHVW